MPLHCLLRLGREGVETDIEVEDLPSYLDLPEIMLPGDAEHLKSQPRVDLAERSCFFIINPTFGPVSLYNLGVIITRR